jgi:hypothetical protein
VPAESTPAEYVRRITQRDETWRVDAACRNSSAEVVTMFTCTEDEEFIRNGALIAGVVVQRYLVDTFCHGCAVQWECAHTGLVEEAEAGDRSTGAWAMIRSDRRWLFKQPDALGIIDHAKLNNIPVHEAVTKARADRV